MQLYVQPVQWRVITSIEGQLQGAVSKHWQLHTANNDKLKCSTCASAVMAMVTMLVAMVSSTSVAAVGAFIVVVVMATRADSSTLKVITTPNMSISVGLGARHNACKTATSAAASTWARVVVGAAAGVASRDIVAAGVATRVVVAAGVATGVVIAAAASAVSLSVRLSARNVAGNIAA